MKWLFSILLIANLGMFIWLYPQADDANSRAVAPSDVGELLLVGETPEPVAPEGDSLTDVEPAQALPPSRPETAASAEQSGVPPMVVTSEQVAAQEPSQPPAGETESVVTASPVCGTLGVFEKRTQAELASVRMLAAGTKTEITAETSNDQAGFWVLIPPQKNRAAAINISKRLEEAGVADLWRFTSGKLAHAISLGLFRDEARARARRDQIAAMGFEPVVRPRYREQTRYWLNYRYTGENPLAESYWQELSREYPQLERNESPCP